LESVHSVAVVRSSQTILDSALFLEFLNTHKEVETQQQARTGSPIPPDVQTFLEKNGFFFPIVP
jgi:hypothetical protein